MSERTESFVIARRKHKGATKPLLPITQGGIHMPRGQATTTLYGGREQPDHQSGTRIADNVPLRFADFIETAINAHDDLLRACKEAALVIAATAKAHGADPLKGTCLPRLLAAIKLAEA